VTFAQLQQAVADRGFNYLQDGGTGLTRLQRVVNQAYQQLCAEELWPFLLTTSSVTAGTTFTDLRLVQSVSATATSTDLQYGDRAQLAADYGDLTTGGSAAFWYLTGSSTLKTYPVADAGATYSVTYWKSPADLSSSVDVPVVPAAWHKLIEDLTVYFLAEDGETKQLARGDYDLGLIRMRGAVLPQTLVSFVAPWGEDN
jgi:hypothetical protein